MQISYAKTMHLCDKLNIDKTKVNPNNYQEKLKQGFRKKHKDFIDKYKVGDLFLFNKTGVLKVISNELGVVTFSFLNRMNLTYTLCLNSDYLIDSICMISDKDNLLRIPQSSMVDDINIILDNKFVSLHSESFGVFINHNGKYNIKFNDSDIILNIDDKEYIYNKDITCDYIKQGFFNSYKNSNLHRPLYKRNDDIYVMDDTRQIVKLDDAKISSKEKKYIKDNISYVTAWNSHIINYNNIPHFSKIDDSVFDYQAKDGIIKLGETIYYLNGGKNVFSKVNTKEHSVGFQYSYKNIENAKANK